MTSTKNISKPIQKYIKDFCSRIINPIELIIGENASEDLIDVLVYIKNNKMDKINITKSKNIISPNELIIKNSLNGSEIKYVVNIGVEFSVNILLSIIHFSGFPAKFTNEEISALNNYKGKSNCVVISDISCATCIIIMQLFSAMASVNENIKVTIWDFSIPYEGISSEDQDITPILIHNGKRTNRLLTLDAISAIEYLENN